MKDVVDAFRVRLMRRGNWSRPAQRLNSRPLLFTRVGDIESGEIKGDSNQNIEKKIRQKEPLSSFIVVPPKYSLSTSLYDPHKLFLSFLLSNFFSFSLFS